MKQYKDQMGRTITLKRAPQRIISVVPSQTELLADMGLEDQLVGITKFCIHPERIFRTKVRVGGTKQLKPDEIAKLQPDLIIGNKEENDQQQIETLAKQYPVWMSDIYTLKDALEMIQMLGEVCQTETLAAQIIADIKAGFAQLPRKANPPRTTYLIWRDPWMAVASDTFIDDMLTHAGFRNVFTDKSRYPVLSIEELINRQPEVLMLSSEPYPFKKKHLNELQTLLPDTQIRLVDGECFSWYGSRLRSAPPYFTELLQSLH